MEEDKQILGKHFIAWIDTLIQAQEK